MQFSRHWCFIGLVLPVLVTTTPVYWGGRTYGGSAPYERSSRYGESSYGSTTAYNQPSSTTYTDTECDDNTSSYDPPSPPLPPTTYDESSSSGYDISPPPSYSPQPPSAYNPQPPPAYSPQAPSAYNPQPPPAYNPQPPPAYNPPPTAYTGVLRNGTRITLEDVNFDFVTSCYGCVQVPGIVAAGVSLDSTPTPNSTWTVYDNGTPGKIALMDLNGRFLERFWNYVLVKPFPNIVYPINVAQGLTYQGLWSYQYVNGKLVLLSDNGLYLNTNRGGSIRLTDAGTGATPLAHQET